MCSIMGYCSRNAAMDLFEKGFEKTISRGPDDSRIVDTGEGILGFRRLAIMGLTPSGMQPFQLGKSFVVCNGEVYGFEKIRKELSSKYSFVSDFLYYFSFLKRFSYYSVVKSVLFYIL